MTAINGHSVARRITRRVQLKALAKRTAKLSAKSRDETRRQVAAVWAYWELDMNEDIRQHTALYDAAVGMYIQRCSENEGEAAGWLKFWRDYKAELFNATPRTHDDLCQQIEAFNAESEQAHDATHDEGLLWLYTLVACTYDLRCKQLNNMSLVEHLTLAGFDANRSYSTVNNLLNTANSQRL